MIKKTLSRNVQYFSNNNNSDNRNRTHTHTHKTIILTHHANFPGFRPIQFPDTRADLLPGPTESGSIWCLRGRSAMASMLSPRQWLPGKVQMRPYPTYTITWITSRSKRPLFACTVTTASAKTKTSSCEMSILYKPITSLVVCQYLTGLSDAYKVIWHHSSGDIFKGLSPVTRNLSCQSARGNRSGAAKVFPRGR